MKRPVFIPNTEIMTCEFKENRKGISYSPHYHDSFEILYLINCRGTITINNVRYEIGEHFLCILFPGDVHSIDVSEGIGYRSIVCSVSPNVMFNHVPNRKKYFCPPIMLREKEHEEMMEYAHGFVDSIFEKTNKNIKLFYELMCFIQKMLVNNKSIRESDEELVIKAEKYVRENLSHKMTTEIASKSLGVCTKKLNDIFQKKYGYSFKTYKEHYKYGIAKMKLEKGKTLREVSDFVGYSDEKSLQRFLIRMEDV